MSIGEIRVADYDQMQQLIAGGKKHGFNRRIPDAVAAVLDPKGLSLVQSFIVHEHIAGKPAEPHLRCGVFLKLIDQEDPYGEMIDVAMEDWDSLPAFTDPAVSG